MYTYRGYLGWITALAIAPHPDGLDAYEADIAALLARCPALEPRVADPAMVRADRHLLARRASRHRPGPHLLIRPYSSRPIT